MELFGKVAIVTGAARGIGEATARKFAGEGASVVVSDVLIDRASHVADEIKSQGGTAIAVKADVAKKTDVQRLVDDTIANFRTIHILINNAGITRHGPLLDMSEEDWDAVMEIDLKGVFICTQAVLPYMIKQRYGKIVNISSIAGDGTFLAGMANYASAKAGVIQLTKVTAKEAGAYGINVNCIAPGSILTEITYSRRSKEEVERHIEKRRRSVVLGRTGKPEDIANLALFLSSDDSSFITGQVIRCDGGFAGTVDSINS